MSTYDYLSPEWVEDTSKLSNHELLAEVMKRQATPKKDSVDKKEEKNSIDLSDL